MKFNKGDLIKLQHPAAFRYPNGAQFRGIILEFEVNDVNKFLYTIKWINFMHDQDFRYYENDLELVACA